VALPNGETLAPSLGRAYVRYGPDTQHWSSWQALTRLEPASGELNDRFKGTVAVLEKDQEPYSVLVGEYSRRDVPWPSDEDAAVRWIVARDPEFFSRNIPFMGYVQVLLETTLHGGQRIARLTTHASWGVSGLRTLPRDGRSSDGSGGPWRYRGSH
jgi:hypothetical protein